MKPYMYSEKLKVDKDIVMDFFHYYKSGEFDPSVPIKVQMRVSLPWILAVCFDRHLQMCFPK